MSKLWGWVVAAFGMLGAALLYVAGQRNRAEEKAQKQERRADTAESRIEQRQRADRASKAAKETGDERVEEARSKARTGRRDHFSSGMRDD